MKAVITKHQLDQIIAYISKKYEPFATQKIGDKIVFESLKDAKNMIIPTPKTIIPFKKILYPHKGLAEKNKRKFAFIGLGNCDAIALDRFLNEFKATDLLPDRQNILVISAECQPDEHCFCTALGDGKIDKFDLHIQSENTGFSIFSGSANGEKILENTGIKQTKTAPEIREITLEKIEKINQSKLGKVIENKNGMINFWQGIANNCFACGACTAVCPLCFCTHLDNENETDGSCKRCMKWDSCFGKSFSEIQGHHDFRPENVDRLYNWYHHKFVRAPFASNYPLCTGCGRCIAACPAGLNQYRIILSATKRKDE